MDANVAAFEATLSQILKNIYWLEFDSSQQMAETFLRFQEHYESPEFAGKFFSLDEFKVWYQDGEKEFTYYEDWSGFNIPSKILAPFREGKFGKLSEQEQQLLSLFENLAEPFYIIGTAKCEDPTPEDVLVLPHEIAHGLYTTCPAYNDEVKSVLVTMSLETYQDLHTWLSPDYAETSIFDEMHAYLLDGPEYLRTQQIGLAGLVRDDVERLHKKLKEVYERYYKLQKNALISIIGV